MTQEREQQISQSDFIAFIRKSVVGQFEIALRFHGNISLIRQVMADMAAGSQVKVLPGVTGAPMIFRISLMTYWDDALREGLTVAEALKLFRSALVEAIQKHKVTIALQEAEVNQLMRDSIDVEVE